VLHTAALFFAFVVFAAAPAGAKDAKSLQIKGSDTMVNLVQSWAEIFMEKNPDTFIAVTGGGSGTGLSALLSGGCDLAMSSREIKQPELESARAKGIQPKETKVALDGLVVVVHPKNPVSHLSIEQLAGIFTGRIKNWNEVGGSDAKIVVLSREVNSGTHVYFKEHVLSHAPAGSAQEFTPEALLMPSSQAIADEVSHNPSAIGYYGHGYISPAQKALAVSLDGQSPPVEPTMESIVSGAYPISRPLYFYTNGDPAGDLRAFVDFALSAEGQAIVTEMDFVPLKK
jgi:phosphate transport system substrate-binding protein